MNSRVNLNIGGRIFTTTKSTLRKIPNSRLSRLSITDQNYDRDKQEYFFDKDPSIFPYILDVYRSGELHIPSCICGPAVKKELKYWKISESYIGDCCWNSFKNHDQELLTFDDLEKTLDSVSGKCTHGSAHGHGRSGNRFSCWYSQWKQAMWAFLDYPKSSRTAQVWQILMFLLIVLSVLVVVLSTHPSFRIEHPKPTGNTTTLNTGNNNNNTATINNITISNNNNSNDAIVITSTVGSITTTKRNEMQNSKMLLFLDTDLHPALEYIDYGCLIIFTIEMILRLLSCPSKPRYLLNIFNLIDVFCIIPDLVTTLIRMFLPNIWQFTNSYFLLTYISLTSVLRVFRLLKLVSHYRVMRLLYLAVKSSLRELALLFLLMIMGMLIFSSIIYFAEFQDCDGPCTYSTSFDSIPLGFWWSIVTMTTVGYGDLVPVTGTGYVIASLCAISGVLATGLPIPIIASNFIHYHKYDRIKTNLKERRKSQTRSNQVPNIIRQMPSVVIGENGFKCCCCFIRPRPVINTVQPVRPSSSINALNTIWTTST